MQRALKKSRCRPLLALGGAIAVLVLITPAASARLLVDHQIDENGATFAVTGGQCIPGAAPDGGPASVPPSVAFTMRSRTALSGSGDMCGTGTPHRHIATGWRLIVTSYDEQTQAQLLVVGKKQGIRRFRYRISSAGVLLQSGTIVARTRLVGGGTFYEGSDEFVNYCIDENRPIHSAGGRLYCIEPQTIERHVRVRIDP